MHPLTHDVDYGIPDKMAKVKVSGNTDWINCLYFTLKKLTYMRWNINLNIVDRDQIWTLHRKLRLGNANFRKHESELGCSAWIKGSRPTSATGRVTLLLLKICW